MHSRTLQQGRLSLMVLRNGCRLCEDLLRALPKILCRRSQIFLRVPSTSSSSDVRVSCGAALVRGLEPASAQGMKSASLLPPAMLSMVSSMPMLNCCRAPSADARFLREKCRLMGSMLGGLSSERPHQLLLLSYLALFPPPC